MLFAKSLEDYVFESNPAMAVSVFKALCWERQQNETVKELAQKLIEFLFSQHFREIWLYSLTSLLISLAQIF